MTSLDRFFVLLSQSEAKRVSALHMISGFMQKVYYSLFSSSVNFEMAVACSTNGVCW